MKKANASNLHGIDHLGRELPKYNEVKPKDNEKTVGMFYYLWSGYHGTHGPYDISKILKEDPNAMHNPNSPAWPDSTNAPMLFWNEPLFGYYLSTDKWVLRRHAQMFIDAGIDLLYFDVTNGFNYRKSYLALFEVLTDLQNQGFNVPKVCFYLAPVTRGCGTGNMMDLWEQLYEPGLCSNLWFYWKGKPLIICHFERSMPDEIRNFFTWRAPTWGAPKRPNTWAWGAGRQAVAVDEKGEREQIACSCCSCVCDHPYGHPLEGTNMSDGYFGAEVHGRSWHNGAKDTRENAFHYGFHLQEEMDNAIKEDVPVAFLCQWNEWLVPFLTKNSVSVPQYDYKFGDIVFRDEFNEEYSRDIEPMKGGYMDAYYMQTVAFSRKFKGMEKPAVDTENNTVLINQNFNSWENIGIEYNEFLGDCTPRNEPSYDAIGKYENYTGRNEFKTLKVASDNENIYFFAECVSNITKPTSENWMTLYLRLPQSNNPAWNGYHFAVNRVLGEEGRIVVEKCAEGGKYMWQKIGNAEFYLKGNKLHLKLPKAVIELTEDSYELEFKWSDNMQEADVMDFYANGDSAPRGRMNWVYIKD